MIVGGDFNTCGNLWRLRSSAADAARAHRLLSQTGLAPALDSTAEPTFFAGVVRGRLDDLYVRALAVENARICRESRGSDHRPLACEVRLRR
jgi:endonuclease/exonuclease/phosphatase (EEP) superfamily protein YafD